MGDVGIGSIISGGGGIDLVALVAVVAVVSGSSGKKMCLTKL